MIRQTFIYLMLMGATLGQAMGQDNTLYWMHDIPMANSLNPAVDYRCNTYIEVPLLSSVQYAYNNTSFAYGDFIHKGTGDKADSIIVDVDMLYNVLQPANHIRNDAAISILGAGFATPNWYITLNVSNKTFTRVSIPKDLLAFKDGNYDFETQEAQNLDLSGLSMNITNYTEFAIGLSRDINDDLRFGARLKYIKGAANLSTSSTETFIESNLDDNSAPNLTIQTNYLIESSFPVSIQRDSTGSISGIKPQIGDPVQDFLLNKNSGYGVDIGVVYRTQTPGLTLAASIVDLGMVNWKSNANSFIARGEFKFEGVDLDRFIDSPENFDFIDELKDSISNAFKFSNGDAGYSTALNTKMFLGLNYRIIPQLELTALASSSFYGGRSSSSLTMSMIVNPWPFLSTSISYSRMNHSNNLGFGLGLGHRGVQFYIVADNVPTQYVQFAGTPVKWPYQAHTLSCRFGFNVILGCNATAKKKKKKRNEKPSALPCPSGFHSKKKR